MRRGPIGALSLATLAVVACNSLLDLDDVQYLDGAAGGAGGAGEGGAGAEGGGGAGGSGPLVGEPEWLYHPQAGAEQRVTDVAFDGESAMAVLVNRGTLPLGPVAPDSVADPAGNDQVLLTIVDGDLERARSWGNDSTATTAELASRDGVSFVGGTYVGGGISIGGALPASCTAPCTARDAYAAKLDRDTDVRWRTSEGAAASDEEVRSVAVMGEDRVLFGGGVGAAQDLFQSMFTPVGDVDAFVVAVDDDDVLGFSPAWSWTLPGSAGTSAWAMALATDETSVAVLIDRPSAGGRDSTLVRLDDEGQETIWPSPITFAGETVPRSVALAPDGDVVVAVAIDGATTLPDGSTLTPEGAVLAIHRYGLDQSEQWRQHLEASSLGRAELAIDPSGRIVVGVTYTDSLTLPGGTTLTTTLPRAVVFKLDSAGELIWHRELISPTEGASEIFAVAALPDGRALVGGSFTGTIDFGLGLGTAAPGSGAASRDGFVLQLSP